MGFTVYCHTSPSGKTYVGQTRRTMEERWREHVRTARTKPKAIAAFYAAIRKYGATSFTSRSLATAETEDDAIRLESEWICKLGTLVPHGYNVAAFGRKTGMIVSEEGRRSRSEAMKRWHASLSPQEKEARDAMLSAAVSNAWRNMPQDVMDRVREQRRQGALKIPEEARRRGQINGSLAMKRKAKPKPPKMPPTAEQIARKAELCAMAGRRGGAACAAGMTPEQRKARAKAGSLAAAAAKAARTVNERETRSPVD